MGLQAKSPQPWMPDLPQHTLWFSFLCNTLYQQTKSRKRNRTHQRGAEKYFTGKITFKCCIRSSNVANSVGSSSFCQFITIKRLMTVHTYMKVNTKEDRYYQMITGGTLRLSIASRECWRGPIVQWGTASSLFLWKVKYYELREKLGLDFFQIALGTKLWSTTPK